MDVNISAQIFRYDENTANQNEIIKILETFEGWVLSETIEENCIFITDRRRGRNHLSIVRPGDYIVSFNNGTAGYFFNSPEQIYKAFGFNCEI